MLADNRTGFCVEGSLGDTLMIVGRGAGGSARALKHSLRVMLVPAPSAVVREEREYVRRMGVVVDGSGGSAEDLVDGLCRQIPVPPGCRLAVRKEGEVEGMAVILGFSLGLGLLAVLFCASAVRNDWRELSAGLLSLIGAVAGISVAAIFFPGAPGTWPYAVAGAVGLICIHAGMVAMEQTGAGSLWRSWILLPAASLAVALFSRQGEGLDAWPVRSVALWIGVGAGIGLPLAGFLARTFSKGDAAGSSVPQVRS
jgi:hypothetical protein